MKLPFRAPWCGRCRMGCYLENRLPLTPSGPPPLIKGGWGDFHNAWVVHKNYDNSNQCILPVRLAEVVGKFNGFLLRDESPPPDKTLRSGRFPPRGKWLAPSLTLPWLRRRPGRSCRSLRSVSMPESATQKLAKFLPPAGQSPLDGVPAMMSLRFMARGE